ncbi:MAG TPA: OsmC family protein [Bacteroidales bacterium]|nr:OsmC family protein [Bacteroidales bacterium]
MSIHKSSAKWNGNLPEGNGKMIVGGGAWEGNFSFKSRFEDGKGTSPEELIAAAHAGCFSMAFSNALDEAGFKPVSVNTQATASLEQVDGGFAITKIKLTSKGKAEGIDEKKFKELAEDAKNNCPVSKALKGVDISLDITLEN